MFPEASDSSDAPGWANGPVLAYWGSVAVVVAGLWLAPALPTQDGPSHLYTLSLIQDLLTGDPERSAVFRLDFTSITNLGFIGVGLALAKAMPLWAVERFVVSLHVVLLAWFATAWLRATSRRVFPAAWLALAFALPWSLFMGFYGFQLGSDLALLALCWVWRIRDDGLAKVAVTGWGCGLVVLLFHAVPAVLLAGLLGLAQLLRSETPFARRCLRAASITLPIVALTLTSLSGAESSGMPVWRDGDYVILYLATFGTLSFASQLTTSLLVTTGWILLCLPGEGPVEQDAARRFALFAGGALALLHVALPDAVGGGGYLTGRYAWWIPLLMLPLIDTNPTRTGKVPRAWLPAALAVVSLGGTLFSAMPSARRVGEVVQAAGSHPVSSTLSAALFERRPHRDAAIEPLRHVASWFVMTDGILATHYQARVAFFPIRLTQQALARLPHVDINAGWETDWSRLPIDALLSIEASQDDGAALARNFAVSWTAEDNRVKLWRRR